MAETCQVHCSSSVLLLHVLNSMAASGPKAVIWGTQFSEKGAAHGSAYIVLEKRLQPPGKLF